MIIPALTADWLGVVMETTGQRGGSNGIKARRGGYYDGEQRGWPQPTERFLTLDRFPRSSSNESGASSVSSPARARASAR